MSHNPNELQSRLDFLELGKENCARVQNSLPFVEQNLRPVLDELYDKVKDVDSLGKLFAGPDHIEAGKGLQFTHWQRVFEGRYDEEFQEYSKRVGRTHAHLGIALRWHIGAYGFILEKLLSGMIAQYGAENGFSKDGQPVSAEEFTGQVSAFIKAVFLDMEISTSVHSSIGKNKT